MEQEVEELEIELLLKVILEKYNIDFSRYRSSYIRRRIERRMTLESLSTITSLTDRIIHDPEVGRKLLKDISINVTDMYRCPLFFKKLKETIIPILKTYPSIKIWHAGCSSGEEVLSMAILLQEEGLYDRTKILATDSNKDVLAIAEKAIYSAERIRTWTDNYSQAGGENSFSNYYDVKYNQAKFDQSLLENVTFKQHNLLTDTYPKNMHLILCRNVLIYFNEKHQIKVISQFHDSLITHGYMGLGTKETIKKDNYSQFKVMDSKYKIYQKDKKIE